MRENNATEPSNPQKTSQSQTSLEKTALYDFHQEFGGKLVPFAGYQMPLHYSLGIMKEHLHVREKCGLFDVSHMGQAALVGPDYETVAKALEALIPGAITTLNPGEMRYTLLMNQEGGIIDDLIVTRPYETEDNNGVLTFVANASRKHVDYPYIIENLPSDVTLQLIEDKALLALQGPKAADVLAKLVSKPETLGDLSFMTAKPIDVAGIPCHVSRSGYTGEDGFEISVPNDHGEKLARKLGDDPNVELIGLGARDSLRLEAGLCLYGHDIDENTSPVEANLKWAIAKKRREGGGFAGYAKVLQDLTEGPQKLRVGLKLKGRAPARQGAEICDEHQTQIGVVTSGGYAPTLQGPIAMGYVSSAHAKIGQIVNIIVRGKALDAEIVKMPFVPQRYVRKI
ncbi:MAG: glycine cleavage system aminomethyltransferase GcvT [Pseudomonadota bacterium]